METKITRWTGRKQARPAKPRPFGGYKSKEEQIAKTAAYREKMRLTKKPRKPAPNKNAMMTQGYCSTSAKHLTRAW